MSERKRMDIKNLNTKLIIAGMTGLVDDGYTPHEVFEVLEDIKQNTFHALAEIHRENQTNKVAKCQLCENAPQEMVIRNVVNGNRLKVCKECAQLARNDASK